MARRKAPRLTHEQHCKAARKLMKTKRGKGLGRWMKKRYGCK